MQKKQMIANLIVKQILLASTKEIFLRKYGEYGCGC